MRARPVRVRLLVGARRHFRHVGVHGAVGEQEDEVAAAGAAIGLGRRVAIGEGTKYGGSRWRHDAVKGKVIDTDAPTVITSAPHPPMKSIAACGWGTLTGSITALDTLITGSKGNGATGAPLRALMTGWCRK